MTGQDATNSAKSFNEILDKTGIILTKMDGTAKGGIALAISDQLNLPVRFLGIGEGQNDLVPFNPEAFIKALLE